MPRKKKKKNEYFTIETERAIIEYNSCDNQRRKNEIYQKEIKYAFEKLAEFVLNTYKFKYFDMPPADVKREVVSALIEKIHMYEDGKGKAFSYFNIVAKNYLIYHNNRNFKRWKQNSLLSEMPETWDPDDKFEEKEMKQDYKEFKDVMLEYWDEHILTIFPVKRDVQIADAILELFRRSENIENFNKKHLYLLIREMTGYKTHYITKVVNTMKSHQKKILNSFLENGTIDDSLIDTGSEYW